MEIWIYAIFQTSIVYIMIERIIELTNKVVKAVLMILLIGFAILLIYLALYFGHISICAKYIIWMINI